MCPLRLLTAAALAAALALPFAAPALCTAIGPTMAAMEMEAPHGPVAVDNHGAAGTCNFAECATAPAAPTVDISPIADVRRVVTVTASPLSQSVVDVPQAPITPPPQV